MLEIKRLFEKMPQDALKKDSWAEGQGSAGRGRTARRAKRSKYGAFPPLTGLLTYGGSYTPSISISLSSYTRVGGV